MDWLQVAYMAFTIALAFYLGARWERRELYARADLALKQDLIRFTTEDERKQRRGQLNAEIDSILDRHAARDREPVS